MTIKEIQPSASRIMEALDEVMDPEIPVISIVEMGLIRDVSVGEDGVVVKMTPTFSGCPALHVIKAEILRCVIALGIQRVEVETVLDPPWTSDWISDPGREKLKHFGLAPPARHGGRVELTIFDPVICPYCDSQNTVRKNAFGPTLCRAIYYCNECQQPFEQFKAL
jgi:ring-1,2-phenylacetyl-CoA epoxidase subunit PaaD